MQKVTLFLSFIFLSVIVFGQTTLEEYNYLTKGYKVQTESGLDMKSGYAFKDVDNINIEERSVKVKILNRVNGNENEIAAYLIIYKRTGNSDEYICVPNPFSEKEIIQKYFTQLYSGEGDSSFRLQIIALALSRQIKWN